MRLFRFCPFLILLVLLTHCDKPAAKRQWRLFDAPHAAAWKSAGVVGEGKSALVDGELTLSTGEPMTCMRMEAFQAPAFPTQRYRIEFETMRTEGADFFGSLTFPVRGRDHLTLILGGWGGSLVGLSSIDGEDASNNSTRGNLDFVNGRWYRVKIELRDEEVQVWIDGRLYVNTNLRGREASLRPGDIESCRPLGFATYLSACRVRGLVVED
ncbi:MAG: hypothetical protein IPK32_18695 [Verrucomicrobiaceae bacterium]|nr:hypothetical protein [Verrucomicrobiaceae bacterium]